MRLTIVSHQVSKTDGPKLMEDTHKKIFNTLRDQFMNWKPTKEMLAAFKPIFAQEMARVEAMKDGGKYKKMWNRWMHGKAKAEMFKMNQEMYKEGGVWDHFAGKDGIMQFEEAKAMNHTIRFMMSKKMGETIPPYPKGHFKKIYDAYNALTKGVEGFSKKDAMTGGAIMEHLKDRVIKEDEIEKFYPMGEWIYDEMDDLKDDNLHKKMFMESIHKPINKDWMEMYFKGFDGHDKNHDGKLNYHEYMQYYHDIEKWVKKSFPGKAPEWSQGEMEFFWTMADSVSNGSWNHGDRRSGRGNVTKRDMRRLNRILREVYKDVEESSDSSDSSDDEEDKKEFKKEEIKAKKEFKKKEAKKALFDEEIFFF